MLLRQIRWCCKLRQLRCCQYSSQVKTPQVAIVGSGPAGFYTAQQILKGHPSACVDIYEKLPVPFGLVRFGVAPDHPEVKNVINTFTKTASDPRCTFIGNVTIGKDVSVDVLKKYYTAVVLAYGSEADKTFSLPGEDLPGVLSARSFVGWYNGLPENRELKVDLDTDTVAVLGQGNVALDVARMLLTPIDLMRKTDTTEYALDVLSKSRVRHVYLIGRRGPLQVAFTTAELREMVRLEGTRPVLNPEDFAGMAEKVKDLPRPRRRLTDLMIKTACAEPSEADSTRWSAADRSWHLLFRRSPLQFLHTSEGDRLAGIRLVINKLEGPFGEKQKAVPTQATEDLQCGLVLRSIGYKSLPVESSVPFDTENAVVPNVVGRVQGYKGLYCSGWVKRGPVGVIVSTMNDGFETGKAISDDLNSGHLPVLEEHKGKEPIIDILKQNGIQTVTFQDWNKIDETEVKLGEQLGKPREKVTNINEMLQIVS